MGKIKTVEVIIRGDIIEKNIILDLVGVIVTIALAHFIWPILV